MRGRTHETNSTHESRDPKEVASETTSGPRALGRRGLVAGAAALVAGIMAKQTSQPVTATTTDTNFVANGTASYGVNAGTSGAFAVGVYGRGSTFGVQGYATDGNGIYGYSQNSIGIQGHSFSSFGIYGASDNEDGIYGTSTGATNDGVVGYHDTYIGVGGYSAFGTGTVGYGNGTGVYGTASDGSGRGVWGHHDHGGTGVYGDSSNGRGVYGMAPGGFGVLGISTSLYGVVGQSTSGIGVVGQTSASNQYGILGTTTAVNSTAIAGIANTNGSSAFSGGTTNPNAFAGVFQGTVVVQGRLIVSDPSYKSGALAHPDGSHRLVYCVESPESWIEDVGTGTLAAGKATVTFDKDFAAVTHTDIYHVFLTSYDPACKGLAVATRTATGFTVQEQNGGTSGGTFSWKVMVKAKSSVKSERLGKFTMPNVALPDLSKVRVPESPAAPLPLPSAPAVSKKVTAVVPKTP